MSRATIATLAIALGCLACETYGSELRPVLERLEFPEDWSLVGLNEGGLGSGFAAASRPYTTRFYSAPWDDGDLCKGLFGLAAQLGAVEGVDGNECACQVRTRSGWMGQMRIRVWLVATPPGRVHFHLTEADCQRDHQDADARQGSLWNRVPECSVPRGRSMVMIRADLE